ncbi:DHA2 family efflux MFS transporter permease subunit [Nocardioides sp. MAH-18]|uniref:DHA2 family efflux MFS transporter permease subunit n=1 Tax=Nocardioides agri TaxID=2682843 RepID=A0A6L6XP65_9ACTN|nr:MULTISPECIES: MFS transporter [unclassified Nocardioides]MBA2953659.1 MFS transporter [Nocardioides sp. CGMCC 1.13656]MVQ48523.1 DHA2 family efflux MFS transporter permease subunit [Nocardioides sp. MAH-18]
MTDVTTTPAGAPPGRKQHLGWALVLISVAQLMVVLDGTIVNIALPFIQSDLDISQDNLRWVVTGYALAFGSLLLLGGRLGDLYGRRKIFMIGLVVFGVASLLGGLATSEATLLAARALQGLGAALASPAALALIATTFPAGPARNRAFAVYAAMSGVGAAVGLLLGGWLTGLDSVFGLDVEGWRLTLLINTPIGIVTALLAPRFLNESESHPGELDLPGAVTGTLGLLGLVYGISRAGTDGWGDTWTIASLAVGLLLLATFLLIESRVAHPLLPTRVFANRTRAASYVAMFFAPAAMFAMFFYLSQYIQTVMGYSSIKAGVAFLPFCIGLVAAAGISSNLINRIDPRILAGVGTLMAAVALFGFSRIPHDTSLPIDSVSADYWTDLFPFIMLMALGMGATFVPLTLTAVHHLRAEDSGIGSGVLNTMQQVGGALGLSLLATVATQTMDDLAAKLAKAAEQAGVAASGPIPDSVVHQVFAAGASDAFLFGAGLMLLASLVTWVFLNVKHEELATDGPEGMPVHVG